MYLITAPELPMQADLTKPAKLGLLTDIDKLLMTEKGRWNMLHYSLIYQS